MSASNGDGQVLTGVPTAQVDAASRLARSIVLAFEVCDEGRFPLTHMQKVALIESALLEFDGHLERLTTLTRLDAFLREFGEGDRDG
jgi:hypothetical protein